MSLSSGKKTYSGKEKAIALCSVLAIIASATTLFLLKHFEGKNNNPLGLLKIGSLETFGPDVKRKFFGTLDFSEIKSEDAVFQKDTIFVGPGSKAKFLLPEYGDFELEPSAVVLVVLDFDKSASPPSGALEAKENKRPQRIRLKLLEGRISFKKAEPKKPGATADSSMLVAPKVVVEVDDNNTLLDLADQSHAVIEKKKDQAFKVIESSSSLKAEVDLELASEKLPPTADLLARAPATEEEAVVLAEKKEAYYRWGAKSPLSGEIALKVSGILFEHSALKAGQVDFGAEKSGGKYFHFYVPNENLAAVEEKIKELLGNTFYSEKVTDDDPKAKARNTRVVFVLFEVAAPDGPAAAGSPPSFFAPYSVVSAEALFSYSRIDAIDRSTGGPAMFISDLNRGVGFEWAQHWSSRWKSFLGVSLMQQKFLTPSDRSLQNAAQTYSGLDVGGEWKPFRRFGLTGRMGMHQRPFIRALSRTSYEIEKIPVTELSLRPYAWLFEPSPFGLLFSLEAGYRLPTRTSTYLINSGNFLNARLRIIQNWERWSCNAGLFYTTTRQNSAISTQNQRDIGLLFGAEFRTQETRKPPQ